jgi:hypothetical protein
MSAAELAPHLITARDTTTAALDAAEAFAGLTPQEARYALALGDAAW